MNYNYLLDGEEISFSNDKNNTVSHLLAAHTREILSLLLEHKIHTPELTGDFLFIVSTINTHGRDQIEKLTLILILAILANTAIQYTRCP